MANFEGSLAGGFFVPKERPQGIGEMCFEIFKRKGTTVTIYGAGNTNAGSDDAQLINTFMGCIITGEAATGADSYYAISDTTTTSDTLTITSSNNIVYSILAFGYAKKS